MSAFAAGVPAWITRFYVTLCTPRMQLASSSPDHTQRQSAGQQLSSWEQTQVDYYPSLQVRYEILPSRRSTLNHD